MLMDLKGLSGMGQKLVPPLVNTALLIWDSVQISATGLPLSSSNTVIALSFASHCCAAWLTPCVSHSVLRSGLRNLNREHYK